MPELISVLLDGVLRRVRDTGALATTRANAMSVISGAQKSVNVATFAKVASAGMTVNAQQLLYQIATVLPRAGQILGVQHDSREIGWIDWEQLKNIDSTWFRRIGSRIDSWSLIGRDILVVYPALQTATTIAVSYVVSPATIADETESNQVPDDEVPLVLNITEIILRIRARQLAGLDKEIKNIETSITARKADIAKRYPFGR